jgi:hypothetical protein
MHSYIDSYMHIWIYFPGTLANLFSFIRYFLFFPNCVSRNANLPPTHPPPLPYILCQKTGKCNGTVSQKYRGLYFSPKTNPSPPLQRRFFLSPAIRLNLLLTHSFWFYFCPFGISFTLLTSISP